LPSGDITTQPCQQKRAHIPKIGYMYCTSGWQRWFTRRWADDAIMRKFLMCTIISFSVKNRALVLVIILSAATAQIWR